MEPHLYAGTRPSLRRARRVRQSTLLSGVSRSFYTSGSTTCSRRGADTLVLWLEWRTREKRLPAVRTVSLLAGLGEESFLARVRQLSGL